MCIWFTGESMLELPETAPKLRELKISGNRLSELKHLNYPGLQTLSIRCKLTAVELGSRCLFLEKIYLETNTELVSFKCSCTLDNLISLIGKFGTPYIRDFKTLDAPLLGRLAQNSEGWIRVGKQKDISPKHPMRTWIKENIFGL